MRKAAVRAVCVVSNHTEPRASLSPSWDRWECVWPRRHQGFDCCHSRRDDRSETLQRSDRSVFFLLVTNTRESGFDTVKLSTNTVDWTLRPHCRVKLLLLISSSAPLNVCSAQPHLNKRQTFHIGRITHSGTCVCVCLCVLTETSYGEDYWEEAKQHSTLIRGFMCHHLWLEKDSQICPPPPLLNV